MSATDNTVRGWREETSPERRRGDGMIRRMPVRLTAGVFWRVEGHRLLDGRTKEARDAEVFSGVGFYARPAAGAKAEAIVAFLGDDGQNPVVVATRDEAARKAIAQLEQNSTAMFNAGANATIVLIKPDGTVEIRRGNGVAAKLPTLADYNALRTFVNAQFSGPGHTHATPSGTTTATTPVGTPPGAPAGTVVLKAQ